MDHRSKCKMSNYNIFRRKQRNLCGLEFGKEFLGKTPKAQPIKEEITKLDFIKNFKLLFWERNY